MNDRGFSTQGLDDAEEVRKLRAVVKSLAYLASARKTVRSSEILMTIEVGADTLLPDAPPTVVREIVEPKIPMVSADLYDAVLASRNHLRAVIRDRGLDPDAL